MPIGNAIASNFLVRFNVGVSGRLWQIRVSRNAWTMLALARLGLRRRLLFAARTEDADAQQNADNVSRADQLQRESPYEHDAIQFCRAALGKTTDLSLIKSVPT